MKAKFKNVVKQNQIYIWAFSLPFFIMLFLFMLKFIYPFGDQSFFYCDLKHQYYPFLLEFQRKLQSGEALTFSWNAGLGSNFIALFAYYLASPFNWLCILFSEAHMIEFISYLTIVKIGLCGVTSAFYFSRHFNTKRRMIAIVALFYALSGYMAAYNWNIMWLDCILLAPLIILGLEQLASNGKYKLYCLSLGLSILSNYYLSLIICIYLVLYFFIVLLPASKAKFHTLLRFTFCSLLAGGLSGVLLLPTMAALPYSARVNSTFPLAFEAYSSPLEVLARHFMNVTVSTIDSQPHYWPNIYCSVAIFLLFPLYILNSEIKWKEKARNSILLLILFLSFSLNIGNYILHGFTFPRDLPARYAFLYILLLLTVCLNSFLHLQGIKKQHLFVTYTTLFLFIVGAYLFRDRMELTSEVFLSTIGFLIIYASFLYYCLYYKVKERSLIYLLGIILIAEAASNTMATSLPTSLRSDLLQTDNTFHKLSERQYAADNGKFYRYDKVLRDTDNDSILQDYPSLSLFSSTANKLLNNYYKRYGMQGETVHITSTGATPFIYAILSGGYTFSGTRLYDNNFYEEISIENHVCLYRNLHSVPMGFCIASDPSGSDKFISDINSALSACNTEDNLTPLDRQNLLARRLGLSQDLFVKLDTTNNQSSSTINVEKDSYVYAYMNTSDFLEVSQSIDNQNTITFTDMDKKLVKELGYQTAGTVITFEAKETNPNSDTTTKESCGTLQLSAYSLDLDCFKELIEKLNANTLSMNTMTADSLCGTVTADKDGYLILSIPYDPGFTVTVDNTETEASVFDNMMIAVPLTAGEHTISLEYYPQGLKEGMLVSLCSLVLFLFLCTREYIQTRNQTHH